MLDEKICRAVVVTFAVALQQKLLKQALSLFEIARVERGDVFPKNEPRPGIRAVEAKDQIPGVRAGRHENPRSIPRNA